MIQTPQDFKDTLHAVGLNLCSLARLMVRLGDDRPESNILRSINRMAAGDLRVNGEMRALLGALPSLPAERLAELVAPKARKASVSE